MSEYNPEDTAQINMETSKSSGNAIAVAAIIAFAIVSLACIAACTIMAYAFILNAPW